MPCCSRLLKVVWLLGLCLWAGASRAEGISVDRVELRGGNAGLQLTASFNLQLNLTVQQALSRGIPFYFVSEYSITRSRWYWLDETVFEGAQTVKFSYNVLTRQYRISRGALYQNFASYDEAIRMLSRHSSPLFPSTLLADDGRYTAAVRMRLDTTQLPRLLQVNVLTSKDWSLDSDWYRWLIELPSKAAAAE